MKEFFGIVFLVGIAVVGLYAFDWFGTSYDVKKKRYFDPQYEQNRYLTFKESQPYNDSVASDIDNLQLEYQKAKNSNDTTTMGIIVSQVRTRISGYDTRNLNSTEQQFVNQVTQ